MPEELRKTGISIVGDVPWGAHFCYFYETKQDLLDILVPYFKVGLESGEFCLWIISNSELIETKEAKEALGQAVSDLDRYLAEGRIEIVPHDQWFLQGGVFDFHRVASRFKEKLDEATRRGYVGMRVNGSPAWIQTRDPKELREFEAEVNHLFPNQRIIASCTYPLEESRAAFLLDVANNHKFVIAMRQGNWQLLETPQLIQAKEEIQRLNQELEQRVIERTRELAAANEELRKEIAERKQAEEALRRSEDHLRLVVETIPAMVFTALPDGSVDFVNKRWLQFLGLPLEGVKGWRWAPTIHPEDRERSIDHWRSTVAAGQPAENELRVRRADGVYRWILGRFTPLHDASGKIVKWYGVSTDIDDRKQAEEALHQSEDRLRLVIDTIPVMAWSLRPDGIVDFLNQRWMDYAGLSLEQYVENPTGPIHPEDAPRVIEKWLVQMAIGEAYDDEMRLQAADGEYRWFLVRTEPLRDDQGNVVKWYGVSIDIEDRRQAEDRLRTTSEQLRALSARLQTAKEEESTRIARELHDELGSALTSLKWNLELLERDLLRLEADDQRSQIREQIEGMAVLIDNTINSVRRISTELRPSVLDDLGLVAAIQSYLRQFQERTGIVSHFESSVADVELAPQQSTAVFRIFQEALTNVLRHAGATRVDIKISADGELVLIVSDNGRGITETERSDALSLGLLGMKERAHLIGGEVDVVRGKEGGTVIRVRVPTSRTDTGLA
jgi:PAS domain S-box-containing protein